MKELSDEQLQQLLDKGLPPGDAEIIPSDNIDLKTYTLLFGLLDKGPEGDLPYSFSANTTRSIKALTNRHIALKWYMMAFAIAIAGLGLTFLLLSSYNSTAGKHFYTIISTYKWVLISLPLLVLFNYYLDRRFKKDELLN